MPLPAREPLVFWMRRRLAIAMAVGVLGSVAGFLMTPAGPFGLGEFPPGRRAFGLIFFTSIFGGIGLVCSHTLLQFFRHRLQITDTAISVRNVFSSQTIRVADVSWSSWQHYGPYGMFSLLAGRQRLKLVIENYSPEARRQLVARLLELFPPADEWVAAMTARRYLAPRVPGGGWRLTKLVVRSCLLGGAACIVLLETAFWIYPELEAERARLIGLLVIAVCTFPTLFAVALLVNVVLTKVTGEEA